MDIIPVIDLMGGVVVHALHGQRQLYRPLHTPLCPTAEATEVVAAFLNIYPFETMYVADLDAIMDKGDQFRILEHLLRRFPRLRFWLDAGGRSMAFKHERVCPIIGSETGVSAAELERMIAVQPDLLLSLDFRNDGFAGDPQLIEDSRCWPPRVIAMSMARVGTRAGPPLDLVRRLRNVAPACGVYAAGGVRGASDLQLLGEAGAAGVLLATALHDGTIGTLLLQSLAAEKKTPA